MISEPEIRWDPQPDGYVRPFGQSQVCKLRRYEVRQARRYDQAGYCKRRDTLARLFPGSR